MPNALFTGDSLHELIEWGTVDRQKMERIEKLVNDIARNGADKGIGNPERLKHKPYWSR